MSDQERWEALVDDDACGDSLGEPERAFVASYDGADALDERAVYEALAASAEPDPVSLSELRAAQQTMAQWTAKRSAPKRGRLIALGSAAIAIAAAAVLWVAIPEPTTMQTDGAHVASGSLMLDNAALGAGSTLPLGRWVVADTRSCIRAEAGTSCVATGSRVRARERGLEISMGDLRFEGEGSVLTPDGTLSTTAAIFGVSVAADGAVVLTVESGRVTLAATDRPNREFAPGDPLPLGRLVTAQASQHNKPEPRVPAPVAAPQLDEPEPDSPQQKSVARPRKRQPAPATRIGPTPAELLATARRHLSEGDDRKALSIYRDLRRAHPKSSAARAAYVSVGEVHLRLGNAKSALKTFDAYLATGSRALAEEALWGRIRALHRLHRGAQRDVAISRLEAKFPDSIYRKRAAAL